ncbi:hypothetical protein [Flavobacterium orientale]|uniref:Uncharacterized protein n=1 Tax=Flavobacterium orientale TaxID=1756020 RepID=A0A917DEN1_9FLAO|nr:hypothetical protein [Flavobacterium orientale]GGD30673.1 hypothetical protein GCM10011343_21050 [Flavobacterium orientale]
MNGKEQGNTNFIRLNQSQNSLLFTKRISLEAAFLKIDLDQLKSGEINRMTGVFKKEKKMETELRSLELEVFKNKQLL